MRIKKRFHSAFFKRVKLFKPRSGKIFHVVVLLPITAGWAIQAALDAVVP